MKRFKLGEKIIVIAACSIMVLGVALSTFTTVKYFEEASKQSEVPVWASTSGLVPQDFFFNSNGIGYQLKK